MIVHYQHGTRFLPARYQAAQIVDFAASQDVAAARLLTGTALRVGDIVDGDARLTPMEFLRLLENLGAALPDDDTPFQLGQQLLPGHQGHLSHALLQSRNLGEAIDILCRYQA
jgi:hypothetical protein